MSFSRDGMRLTIRVAGLTGLVGGVFGLVQGFRQIASHDYWNQEMDWLAILALQDSLNLALVWAFSIAFGLALVGALAYRVRGVDPVARQAARHFKLVGAGIIGILLAYLVPAMAWQTSGWLEIELWLRSLDLRDVALWSGSILFWWLALQVDWVQFLQRRPVTRAGQVGLGLLALAVVFQTGAWLAARVSPTSGPNVILIYVDTLRADALGTYGNPRDVSPALDALAADSIVFENAIAAAPWTSPSVGAALTSRYPSELGFNLADAPSRTGDDFLFMAEVLKQQGYRTQAIVSHTYVAEPLGFGQGFDAFDSENAQGHDYVSSPSVTQKALDFLNAAGGEPFFLFLHYFDPHFSYLLHQPYDYFPDYDGLIASGSPYLWLVDYSSQMQEKDIQYVRALYDSEVRFTDDYIGMVLTQLKEQGLYENSIIIFAGDHGEAFRERKDLWIGHSKTLYQELLRVPLFIKLDGNRPPQRIATSTGLIHLLPSLMRYLKIPFPRDYRFEGRRLPLADPEALASHEPLPIFSETQAYERWLQSLTLGDWKLIYNRRTNDFELYDLASDPGETTSLVDSEKERLKVMASTLGRWSALTQARSRERVFVTPSLTQEQLEQLRSLGYIQ